MDNDALRKQQKQRRQNLSIAQQQHASQQIKQHLSRLKIFIQAQNIAGYQAIKGEVDCAPCLALAWQLHKSCFLPTILPNKSLAFVRYQPHEPLQENQFGIAEPIAHAQNILANDQLEVVLTPLVAFDAQGHRLGMGGGYYDRSFHFLKNTTNNKPILIGLAYNFQQVAKISTQAWDIPLNYVITPDKIWQF